MKQQSCKFTLEDGTRCKSVFHTAMYHKERKTIKRSEVKVPPIKIERLYKAISRVSKKKAPTRSQLVKKLDAVFSQYIRLKESIEIDGERYATCVTSGEQRPWKQLQCGHFYTRGRYATRWDEMNCHPQSYRDNVLLKGNYINYTRYMIDRYGREAVDELERKSLSTVKISSVELKEMIEKYKKLVAEY